MVIPSAVLRRMLYCAIDSPVRRFPNEFFPAIDFPGPLISSLFRSYASQSEEHRSGGEVDHNAQSLSSELLKDPSSDPLSLQQRLDLHFSNIPLSPSLLLSVLNMSPDAGRAVIDLLHWVASRSCLTLDDETLSYFIAYLGRRKDFKAIHDVLTESRGVAGVKSFESFVDRLVRAGRPSKAVSLFSRMEKDYKFIRNRESLRCVVLKLCERRYASYAEKLVKKLAQEFFPDDAMCDLLIKGWCANLKLDEARRLADEMYRGGYEIGTASYNAILDCVCKLCRKKDPFRMKSEVRKVLSDMEKAGVGRDVETFNVLIRNFSKIRMTEESLGMLAKMNEYGCDPNAETFVMLIRSLFQAGRLEEGDDMMKKMRSAGFGEGLNRKTYYGFLKILCGIERIDHAIRVFAMMKEDGHEPGVKSCDLLMAKLSAHGRVDAANALFSGVAVKETRTTKARTVKKKKKKKGRETLPEKMARKRTKLKRIRLSYVKPSKFRARG